MADDIEVGRIRPAPDNLRRELGRGQEWKEFVQSVRESGIVTPLLVRPHEEGHYEIVAGHRRFRAAMECDMATVPCEIRDMDDVERFQVMLVENLQREGLDPVEEASGYFRLVESGMTQADLASKVGRSRKLVASRLRLLELPARALALLKAGKIDLADAEMLLPISDRHDLVEHLLDEGRISQWAVEQVQREDRDTRRRADTLEALAADGATVVEYPRWGNWRECAHKPLEDLGLDPQACEGQEWLAAAVDEAGNVCWCTTDVAAARKFRRSKEGRQAVDPKVEAAREEARAERREERDRNLRRLYAGYDVVTGRLPSQRTLLAAACQLACTSASMDEKKLACHLIGLEAPKEQGNYRNWGAAFDEYAQAEGQRAMLALFLARGLQPGYWNAQYADGTRELLEARGHAAVAKELRRETAGAR